MRLTARPFIKALTPKQGPFARIMVISFLLVGLNQLPASAYNGSNGNYYSGGLGFKNINVQLVNVAPYWSDVLDVSRLRWNNSAARTSIARVGSSGGKATASNYDEGWYGLYTPSGTKCSNRVFLIQINARTIVRDFPASQHDDQNKRVFAHELGHGLSLGDYPNAQSLMQSGGLLAPTKYDTDLVLTYNSRTPCQINP